MKTLADLKRNAQKFQWSLIKNSWYKDVPAFQQAFRDIGRIQSTKFTLWTNKDGQRLESWIYFPKAIGLTINPINAHGVNMGYEVTFTRDIGTDDVNTMTYLLRHNEG